MGLKNNDIKIDDEYKAVLLVVSFPLSTDTSKKLFCRVIMISYLLKMLNIIYYSNKNLILKFIRWTRVKA